MTAYLIYGLYDLREPERTRYVGKSSGRRGVKDRIYHHKWLSRKETSILPSSRWIRKIGEENLGYRILRTSTKYTLDVDEIQTIAHYRRAGQADLNILEGGGGRSAESLLGDLNPNATATWETVRYLRERASREYVSTVEAGKYLGINSAAASKVLRNATWVDDDYDPNLRVRAPEGSSPWRSTPDKDVEGMRLDYLSGMKLSEVSRKWGRPLSTINRLVLQKHGSAESLKLCLEERKRRSDKLNMR